MARIFQHMALLIFVRLGETVAGSVISWHRSPATTNTNGSYMFTGNNGNQIPLEWMCDGEDDCSDASDETSCHFRNKGDRLSPHMKKDDSKFKEAPKKLDNPISTYIFFSHAYEIKSLQVAIVGDDDDCVYLEYVPIRVTDEDDDLVFERRLLLWVPTYNNYYSGRKQNRYSITESVYAVKSRHNDLLYLDSTCDPLSLGSCEDNVYWVHIIKFDGTRSDDLVLLKRLQCRPGIKVNGHHKALYRKIKWTKSVHLYLSFSLKSNEDNGYLWTDTDGAWENVFVTVFCKTFGVKNPPGSEEKRGEIFYQRSGDERVDLNIPHPEKPKSEKDRGGVDKLWDPIASLGVISLLLVTIYRCSPGTKVTNITKCKVVKVKGQHGGVVIAGDYATVNFH